MLEKLRDDSNNFIRLIDLRIKNINKKQAKKALKDSKKNHN